MSPNGPGGASHHLNGLTNKSPVPYDTGDFDITGFTTNKKSTHLTISAFQKKGDDILSHNTAVPSALTGLTSLFGMGRGEPRCYSHLKL